MGRRITMYFVWDRVAEAAAPLADLDDRFPALFEVRRLFWPAYETLGSRAIPEQGIAEFIDHIFLPNFRLFTQLTESWTQQPVRVLHRRSTAAPELLDRELLSECETLIVISFDTRHSGQEVTPAEAAAVRAFLTHPNHTVFVCPHHDIGYEGDQPEPLAIQKAEFEHHGDKAIPGRQRFGYFAQSLMRSLGIPIRNRFGFHPAVAADGQPMPFVRMSAEHAGLLTDLSTLNLHPHLPHFERLEQSIDLLGSWCVSALTNVRRPIRLQQNVGTSIRSCGREPIYSKASCLTDATLWNSASGGLNELQKLWRNVALGKSDT